MIEGPVLIGYILSFVNVYWYWVLFEQLGSVCGVAVYFVFNLSLVGIGAPSSVCVWGCESRCFGYLIFYPIALAGNGFFRRWRDGMASLCISLVSRGLLGSAVHLLVLGLLRVFVLLGWISRLVFAGYDAGAACAWRCQWVVAMSSLSASVGVR